MLTLGETRLASPPAWRSAALGFLAVGLVTTSVRGQMAGVEDSPSLARLAFLIGEWEVTGHALVGGREVTNHGSASVQWTLRDTWLTARVEMTLGDTLIAHGRRHIAHDAARDEYREVWIDSQSSTVWTFRGRWIGRDTLLFQGDPVEWRDGNRYTFRRTIVPFGPSEFRERHFISTDDGATYVEQGEQRWRRKS